MERFIEIESTVDNICKVEDFITSVFFDFDLSNKLFSKVYLSVNEAVNNAFFHGNINDSSKKVKIYFYDSFSFFQFLIEDEGFGFKFTSIDDPTNVFNRRRESGRGIFIMKQYADDVSFQKNGSVVKLVFNK
jgi:serine/threonine-protein kinase RsbW